VKEEKERRRRRRKRGVEKKAVKFCCVTFISNEATGRLRDGEWAFFK
jgi:hypothetical protein